MRYIAFTLLGNYNIDIMSPLEFAMLGHTIILDMFFVE